MHLDGFGFEAGAKQSGTHALARLVLLEPHLWVAMELPPQRHQPLQLRTAQHPFVYFFFRSKCKSNNKNKNEPPPSTTCQSATRQTMDEVRHRTAVDADADEAERAPEPLSPGEGAIAGLPGATYVSRAFSPAFAYRLARNVRPFVIYFNYNMILLLYFYIFI